MLTAALLAACVQDVSVNVPNVPGDSVVPPPGGGGGGSVQRANLSVTVTVAPEDAGLATAVGSPGGVLRDAFVTIWRQGGLQAPLSNTTDAAGTSTFTMIVPGSYVISVARLLTAEETAGFAPADQDVNAFGGGSVVNVSAPEASMFVEVAAGRRGSLLISEVSSASPRTTSGQFFFYYYGHYVELYNNSDTTIPLGGKVIGRGLPWHRDFSPPRTCADLETWRNDPDGIWTRIFDAFPSMALAPGGAVLVATDAIDHSAIVAGMPDLTGAQFEFIGSNDVDNPNVPNMIRSGLAEWGAGLLGHGFALNGGFGILFVAESLSVDSLPRDNLPPLPDPEYARIPREKILDTFTTGGIPELEAEDPFPLCAQLVHQNFDRQYANLEDARDPQRSMRRRVFATLPNGRVILLRTRSSRNDFEAAASSPGFVP